MADVIDASGGHPVLDSLIASYRASLGRNTARDRHRLRVLQLWEIAAQTSTEAEALQFVNSLYSLAIDHYQAFRPAPVPRWNLVARHRNLCLRQEVVTYLSAAAHADHCYFYMVKTYPGVVRMRQEMNRA